MAKGSDKNHVSIWFWLFAMIVMVIPLVNIIMTVIWALAGENESRKNYFKAIIIMFFVLTSLAVSLGLIPPLIAAFQRLTHLPK